MMVVVLCYKCKVNMMKDNLALESINEEKTQSLHTSQVSVKNNHYILDPILVIVFVYTYSYPIVVPLQRHAMLNVAHILSSTLVTTATHFLLC